MVWIGRRVGRLFRPVFKVIATPDDVARCRIVLPSSLAKLLAWAPISLVDVSDSSDPKGSQR